MLPEVRGCRWALLAALSAGCAPEPELAPLPRERLPDVLLVSIDTLRADHLGCYGYERHTSPFIDSLSAEGVRFEQCWSPTSWTLPSHLSLLTGLSISAHGIDDDRHWVLAKREDREVPLRGVFLPEVLETAGYTSAGFYRWMYVAPKYGFGAGFDEYQAVGPFVDDPRVTPDRSMLFEPWDQLVVDRALEWFDGTRAADPDAPRALFVHLFDVHESYTPPAPFNTRFTDPDYAGSYDGTDASLARLRSGAEHDDADVQHLIDLYDGELAWVDTQVERLVEGLRARTDRELLTIVTADHGEAFFEHGHQGHRQHLWSETTHVPWIVHWPERLAPRAVGGDVGLIDVAPTLYGLLGLDPPPGLSGRDLTAVLCGQEPNRPTPYTSSLVRFRPGPEVDHLLTVRAGDDLFLVRELADSEREILVWDRDERPIDLSTATVVRPEHPLRDDVRELLAELREGYRAQRDLQPHRAVLGRETTAAERERLAALGYGGATGDVEGSTREGGPLPLVLDGGLWLELARGSESGRD